MSPLSADPDPTQPVSAGPDPTQPDSAGQASTQPVRLEPASTEAGAEPTLPGAPAVGSSVAGSPAAGLGTGRTPSEGPSWRLRPVHRAWLKAQVVALLRFHRATLGSDGWFVDLDDDGGSLGGGGRGAQQLLTVARAVHSYALGELLGVPGCREVVVRGLTTLWEDHRDHDAGGYGTGTGGGGTAMMAKTAYGHAFVMLAASSALAAGHQEAGDLLADVLDVVDARFWVDGDGAAREAFDGSWREVEAYRGANSNMHLCESYLAAADVTGRPDLADRALRISRLVIGTHARSHGWLVPEHFDAHWRPDPAYNTGRPDDPFRPPGATIGHGLEWARLLLGVREACPDTGPWLGEASERLFARAVAAGWDRERGGLSYTVGWDGAPANPDHYWWPVAEGIAASAALGAATGGAGYERWYRRLWDYASSVLIDHRRGGWYPEFDDHNRRKHGPWHGKPDLYHALQAALLPTLPAAPSVAGAVLRALEHQPADADDRVLRRGRP